ncbi:MAG: hypothetical protein HYV95_02395 [Opitutae bacterium]|nr:hypothetical protein [Opitutae bacterium]
MPAPVARQFPVWLQAVAVALAAGLAVALVFGRTGWHDWTLPHWLEGDPLEVYARVQIAAEQPRHALTSFAAPARLGAPFGADWAGYPVPDRLVFTLTGALARLTGLVAAVQLVGAGFFMLNAVSFFLCARWLGRRWEWAAAFALGFAFCNYNLRWGITLSLNQTFTLPPLVLLCAHAARHAAPIRRGRWLGLGGALGLWLGMGNPYLAYFACVVGGGALVLALQRRAPRSRLAPQLLFLGVLTLTFVASNATYAWQHWHGPDATALTRDLSDFTRYALRPLDWIVPPADHRLAPLAQLGRAYQGARAGGGEFFYDYLGLLGVTGFVWLAVTALRRLPRGRGAGFDAGLGLAWLIVFGVAGGVNSWLGAAGVDMFRASTRIGVFASVWAGFFLCGRLARATRRLPRVVSVALALGCAAFTCWEQTPPLARRAPRENNFARWSAHRQLAAELERALPPAAAVFQLPVTPFPEAGRTVAMPDYEHFLPFLTSSTLRFSYGHLSTAPAQRWSRHIAALPAAELVAALERTGVSALWIDRRGYADEAARLVAGLRTLGLTEIPVPTLLPISVFRLHAAISPVHPDLTDPRLQDAWDDRPATPGQPQVFALRGWYGPERDGARRWRWAGPQASLGLWWDGPSTRLRFNFAVAGRSRTRLHLRVNGVEIWSVPLSEGAATAHQLDLDLRPGLTTLEWTLEGKTFRPGGGDRRELGFMIENPAVSVP